LKPNDENATVPYIEAELKDKYFKKIGEILD